MALLCAFSHILQGIIRFSGTPLIGHPREGGNDKILFILPEFR